MRRFSDYDIYERVAYYDRWKSDLRAVEVTIHNFRSVHHVSLRLEELSLLAGANNAGKSNIIDAIRLFYGDIKWDQERDTPKVPSDDNDSWVEVEFRPTSDELEQLKDEYRTAQGTFRLRNYVSPSKGPDNKFRSGYYAYENGVLSENLFYGAKNVGSGKIGHLIYIPAVSKVDDNTKLTGPSALRDLVSEVLNKVVANSQPYQELTSAFRTFETEVKALESDDGRSFESLETEITNALTGWDASFSLSIDSVRPDEILKSLIKPLLIDETHGGEIDQSRFGAGFQRHLVYTLIKLAAHYSKKSTTRTTSKKEFAPELTWILFEEPEAFLHPTQEEVLHDSVKELVADEQTQVLLTTHSSLFVSQSVDDLTRLVRLRRSNGITDVYQMSQEHIDKEFDSAFASDQGIISDVQTPEDWRVAAGKAALKTELWLQMNRTVAFFSERVILVEGPSETALYSYLTSRGVLSRPIPGLVVVDCLGKYNMHRFMALLSAFGIDHSVMYDGDQGKAKDQQVTAAINQAKSSFTKKVIRLEQDIESLLGIQPLPRHQNQRKPQHLLYHLEAGLVTKQHLDVVTGYFMQLATA